MHATNLIDHFIEQNNSQREIHQHDNFVRKIAHHQTFDTEDVVHMMFITPRGDRKCLVFLRKDDTDQRNNKKVIYKQKCVK